MALFGRAGKSRDTEPSPAVGGATPTVGEYTVAEYREHLFSVTDPMQPFGVGILAALDLPLCETIIADFDVPHFDTVTEVGYGVRAQDVRAARTGDPVHLAVVGEVLAGDVVTDTLAPQTAMRVGAGAPVPPGVDAVVPLAATDQGESDVSVYAPVDVGANLRRLGDDIAEGDVVAHTGDVVTPRMVGLLAGIGIDRVLVRPRPRVVCMSFARDAVDPGAPLNHRGEAYDAASWLVAAAAADHGAAVVHAAVDLTKPTELRQTLADQMIRADLIITVGGAEPGGALRDALAEDAAEFVTVDMHPGPNHGFCLLDGSVPMVMLPAGNVAAAVGFTCFVEPLLRHLQGLDSGLTTETGTADVMFSPDRDGVETYVPIRIADGAVVPAGPPQTELQAMSAATGFAIVPDKIAAGDPITYLPLRSAG